MKMLSKLLKLNKKDVTQIDFGEYSNKSKQSAIIKFITIVGLSVLLGFYLYWLYDTPKKSFIHHSVGFVCAVMSGGIFARFVPLWIESWSKNDIYDVSECKKVKILAKDCTVLLMMNAVVIFAIMLGAQLLLKYFKLETGTSFWLCTDSAHYIDIAREWYLPQAHIDRLVQLVFFPGYPILVRIVNFIINDFIYSGLLVSWCSLIAATFMFYKLIKLDWDEETAFRAIKYLLICPCVFFYIAPMSDSLFLFLCVSCIYFVRTNRVCLGCILGGFASFTRSLGITLLVPVLFEVISSLSKTDNLNIKTVVKKLLPIPLIFSGFLAYLYINYDISGNPFQFMVYQREHWQQNFGFYFATAARFATLVKKCFIHGYWDAFVGKVLPNLLSCFVPLALVFITAKKLPVSYIAWFIAYYMVSIGATNLLSGPRYMMASFPLFISLSLITENKTIDKILSFLSVVMLCVYMVAFVNRWGVW